jgi:hypothetical protein
VRVFAVCVAVALCAACGQSDAPGRPGSSEASSSSQPAGPTVVEPEKVMRVRSDVPPGYEVTDLGDRSSPVALWGFGAGWASDPTQCGGLADAAGDGPTTGFSASGPGGIVYAVVAAAVTPFDPALVHACGDWTLTAGRTTGTVTPVGPPTIDGVATLGMATDSVTVVEGGTETHSHADTFIAYLGDHVAYVVVVTDPGSSTGALGPDVAADLLVKTVSAVRG